MKCLIYYLLSTYVSAEWLLLYSLFLIGLQIFDLNKDNLILQNR